MNSEAYVHLGQWTNWADGPLRGPRLTLTESGGAYLIAFLALFVRMAGQHSWGILCYMIFQGRQKKLDVNHNLLKDPVQSILRNVHIDVTAAWQFLALSKRPRFARNSLWKRCTLYTLIAVLHTALFLAAGIFVSKVTATGKNEVLLRGQACGIWQNPSDYGNYGSGSKADILENEEWVAWNFETSSLAGDFSRQCYNTTAANSALANCNAYAPSLLSWEATVSPCPFDKKMCSNGRAIRLDSGLLDSLHHFGVNAPETDRIKHRRVVQCSPLLRDGYVSGLLNLSQIGLAPSSLSNSGVPADQQQADQYQEYRYGPSLIFNTSSTYTWNNLTIDLSLGNAQLPLFIVDAEVSFSENPEDGTFLAIQELAQTHADVITYFLTQTVEFIEPVHDPWFQATIPVPESYAPFSGSNLSMVETVDIYAPDYPAGVMGCTQQFQYCNHDGSKCSILAGQGYGGSLPNSTIAFAEGLDLSSKQLSTLSRLQQAAYNQGMYTIAIQPNGLLAQSSIAGTWAPPLPDNQWVLEMQHYFLTSLTAMQMQLAAFATGPPDASFYQYLAKPTTEEEWMCSSQVVQRSGYSTFSVLGLGIVIGVGSLLVIVNVALPPVGKKFSRHKNGRGTDRWEEYHHLETCSLSLEKESNMHFVEPADSPSKTPQTKDATVSAVSTRAASDSTTYVNEFSRHFDSTDDYQPPSRHERLRNFFGRQYYDRPKPADETTLVHVS